MPRGELPLRLFLLVMGVHVRRRNEYLEFCSLPESTVDGDQSAIALDNGHHGGKTEAGSLSDLFRGEEGVEYFIQDFRWNTGTRIRNGECDIIPRLRIEILPRMSLVNDQIFG